MNASAETVAVIVAAGKGERAGSGMPKQFAPLLGEPMVQHSFRALSAHPAIDRVLVVIAPDQIAPDALADSARAIGGATRRASVAAALETIAAEGGAHRVLVHDAARPFVPAAVIDRLLAALDKADGVIPVLPVVDTLVRRDDGAAVDRAALVRVQTPQAFAFDVLLTAHRGWAEPDEPTDDAGMLAAPVLQIEGDRALEKITYPADFVAAEMRGMRETRSATGFDVHRLADGEELWLGGVLIPHSQGLSGHSDADVALHALTDALLGTIAAGDIGTHFPPSDMQWKGASSDRFLRHAADLIAAHGGRIGFVDLTLICEAPKIGPHRTAIQARIAELLGLSTDRVSIKATTSERLGFTGRGEGIAAQAIATITLPGTVS